jgi:hypothetical protein
MKVFDNPNKKTYCYKSDCKYVESGFQARENFFYVCTICHEEISQNLKNTIDSRKPKEEDNDQTSWLEIL